MQHGHGAPSPVSAGAAGPLKGRLRAPGDKSISHRSMIFGLLAAGAARAATGGGTRVSAAAWNTVPHLGQTAGSLERS